MKSKRPVAVITGGTKGLGRDLSLAFATAGYEVIGIYRSDSDSATDLQSTFEAAGLSGTFIKRDISEDGEWPELIEVLRERNFDEYVFVANACVPFTPKPIHLIEWAEISQQIDVNVKGTFSVFKQLISYMVKARKGTVVSVLSTALDPPSKGFAAYVTAKSALDGLTRSIAAEYGQKGIRAFSVSPGLMDTTLLDGWSDHLKSAINAGRDGLQQPNSVAGAILELVKDPSVPANGETYRLDDPGIHSLEADGRYGPRRPDLIIS